MQQGLGSSQLQAQGGPASGLAHCMSHVEAALHSSRHQLHPTSSVLCGPKDLLHKHSVVANRCRASAPSALHQSWNCVTCKLCTGTSCKLLRRWPSPCAAGVPPLQRTGGGPGSPAALLRAGCGALGQALSDCHGLVCAAACRGKLLPVRMAAWGHPQLPTRTLARQRCRLCSVLLSACIIFLC